MGLPRFSEVIMHIAAGSVGAARTAVDMGPHVDTQMLGAICSVLSGGKLFYFAPGTVENLELYGSNPARPMRDYAGFGCIILGEGDIVAFAGLTIHAVYNLTEESVMTSFSFPTPGTTQPVLIDVAARLTSSDACHLAHAVELIFLEAEAEADQPWTAAEAMKALAPFLPTRPRRARV